MHFAPCAVQVMESFVNLTKAKERLLPHPELAALIPLDRSTPIDVAAVIGTTRSVAAARGAIDSALAASMRQLGARAAELDELRPIRDFAASFDAQAYKAGERSVVQFRADMLLLRCAATSDFPRLAHALQSARA
jgi:hypothetical protein